MRFHRRLPVGRQFLARDSQRRHARATGNIEDIGEHRRRGGGTTGARTGEQQFVHVVGLERERVPDCLEVTARSDDGEIMGVRHREHAVEGVQFHPEAILTEHGHEMLRNFLAPRVH